MGKTNAKMTNAQVLAAMAGGFVVVAILFIVIAGATETFALATFGGILMAIGVLAGVVGIGMNAFRR
jgi:hypothetical protein